MENPFVKLVRQGEAPEKKKVINTKYKIIKGHIYVEDIYEDGSAANELTELYVDPSDSMVAREAYKDYRRRKGIENWADLDLE